jgi:hypothetical protein
MNARPDSKESGLGDRPGASTKQIESTDFIETSAFLKSRKVSWYLIIIKTKQSVVT